MARGGAGGAGGLARAKLTHSTPVSRPHSMPLAVKATSRGKLAALAPRKPTVAGAPASALTGSSDCVAVDSCERGGEYAHTR